VPDAPKGVENAEAWRYHYYKKHYFDKVDFGDAGLIRSPVFKPKFMRYIEKVASPHYDSLKLESTRLVEYARADSMVFQYVTIELLNHFVNSKIMCHDAIYVQLVDLVYSSGDAWWADEEQVKKMTDRANALRHTMCGNITPPITMLNTENERKSLYSLDKNYTVLYFWDYDCGHCKKVTPALSEWFAGADHSKIDLMTVSINGDVAIWKERLAKYGLDTLPAVNVQDHKRETGFGYYYDLRSTPRIFLLDEEKHILAKQISVETLDDILNRMMKDKLETGKGKK
jgi:thiol-disulfide isomerase/thioredoxin